MSNIDKMKRDKKIRNLRAPFRLFYLSSIAAALTIFGTTLFTFYKKKEEFQPEFKKLKKMAKKPTSILTKILGLFTAKK